MLRRERQILFVDGTAFPRWDLSCGDFPAAGIVGSSYLQQWQLPLGFDLTELVAVVWQRLVWGNFYRMTFLILWSGNSNTMVEADLQITF